MHNSAARLRAIKTFEDLTRYLEEQLDWPLEEYGFDDLTFEYSPAELGLKDEDAAKIKAIHQLRPLQHGQPWGIFFVEFEKKRMPVVVLRRILSHLVLKKRASANKAQSAAWDLGDLLFISAYGDEASDQREIAFAHFHQEAGDLPTLRVLGWDGADTTLKLDHVAATLQERLRWPANPGNHEAWRQQWSQAFRHRIGHVIRTSNDLAERLALLARGIRDAARTLMLHEASNGSLRRLHKAFQTSLIHDLSEADFADTYAQTITYGLLTAAISRTEMSEGRHGTNLIAGNVTDMVPITNPFLREMLQTFLQAGGQRGGINFDELGIQDVVELLRGDETDLPAILRDFGNRTRGEDPVIHFYEHFLAAYNKQLKVQRGVFYTPQAVVSYIVRSVHELLQSEFGIEDGLASTLTWREMAQRQPGLKIPDGVAPDSPFVQILDPATGTATFLVEVIDVIHRTLAARWKQQRLSDAQQRDAWNAYVPQHLLPRLHGYELMMAPYAIAHMKIGLKLHETGYRFGSDERARIYLTNALEPASDSNQQLAFADWAPALAHEAQAVNAIKRDQRFTVVVGNPPYSYASENNSPFIRKLIDDYMFVDGVPLGERNPKGLQDDYVKFIRFGQWQIEQTGKGVLAYISNNGFLNNSTFRGMRLSLTQRFNDIYVLNLHGNANKKERALDGGLDENVFDIRQGVAVTLFVKRSGVSEADAIIHNADRWGLREDKYAALTEQDIAHIAWQEFAPSKPFYLFTAKTDDEGDYKRARRITDIFSFTGEGFKTHRDSFAVAPSKKMAQERMSNLLSTKYSDEALLQMYGLQNTKTWTIAYSRKQLRIEKNVSSSIKRCLYRPFDWQFCILNSAIMDRPRMQSQLHMDNPNLGLATTRSVEIHVGFEHVLCVDSTMDHHAVSLKEANYLFPLYLYPSTNGMHHQASLFNEPYSTRRSGRRQANFSSEFIKELTSKLGMKWLLDRRGDLHETVGPEDVFHYAYSVFHSPSYRASNAELLKIDFPRLPLTSDVELFRDLAHFGADLVDLHLLRLPGTVPPDAVGGNGGATALINLRTSFPASDSHVVEKPRYDEVRQRVYINKQQFFEGVDAYTWAFRVGGYQVCEKWLKDRKGRALSPEDIEHYQRIVAALHETIGLMQRIDDVIEEHGGWPGAFSGA